MAIEQWASILIAAGALVTALIAIYQARAQKQQTIASADKSRADISSTSILAAAEIIDDLREENNRLRKDRLDRDGKIKELRSESLNLQSQLLQATERITALETLIEVKQDNNAKSDKEN